MDINSAIQQFTQLVNSFTSHKDFTEQGNKLFKQKQRQLLDFSKNYNSLPVCLLVLQNSSDSIAVYFASQFVKDKLKFEFEQLKPDVIAATHNKIINIIRTKTKTTRIVTSNLALCLSFLYIHCYDKLGSVLEFFKNTFTSGASQNQMSGNLYYQYLFRYLDGLVCEVDSRRLVIDQMKRIEVQKKLRSQQTQILTTLHTTYSALSQPGSPIKLSTSDLQNILYSFSEWLKIQENPSKQILIQIHKHSVLTLALSALDDQELSEAATECLLGIIEVVSNPEVNGQFYQFIGENIPILIKGVNSKIKQQQFDEAQNYIRVLCQYGRHAGKKMIDQVTQQTFTFLQKMIKYTQDPILQVFRQLCDFWQSIIYFISNRSGSNSITPQQADALIGKLYITFCQRIVYSPTQVHQLNQLSQRQLQKLHQSIEDTRERRQNARYIFQSIGKYFGVDRFVSQVYKIMLETDRKQSKYWGTIQTYIYSLRDIVKSCVQPTQTLCKLLLFYQSLDEKHTIVMKSMLRLESSLLTMQNKNQEFILKILSHAVLLLDDKILNEKAAENFQKCCEQNSSILIKHIETIYNLLNKYPNRSQILTGLTYILKKHPTLLQSQFPKILRIPLERLQNSKSKKDKKNQFNKLFTIIQCIPKQSNSSPQLKNLIQKLLKDMWPLLSKIIKQPQNLQGDQDKLVQRSVKFLKLVMRSIPQQFIKYLKQIFNIVLQSYKKHPINSFIYLFQVTFTVYQKSTQQQLIQYIQNLYQQICKITYQHLVHIQTALVNYQHLVDDFIGLNKRIVTFNTRMFLQSGQAQYILQFSIHCLGSSIPRITSSASQLFQIIFMLYWSAYSRQQYKQSQRGQVVQYNINNVQFYKQLKQFILPIIPNLLRRMFKFLQIGPVQSARSNTLDCFEAVALAFPNQSQVLWADPLNQLQEDIITATQKQRLKQNLIKIGSQNHLQFINAQQIVKRLMFTISSRYLFRQSRAENLTNK